jgi:type IV pilus assembly protein PilY1
MARRSASTHFGHLDPRATRRTGLALVVASSVLGVLGSDQRPAMAAPATIIQPPVPNVLLLLDTSGSMEYWSDNTIDSPTSTALPCTPDTGVPCSAVANATHPAANKWGSIITALSGSPILATPNVTTGTGAPYYYYEMARTAGSDFDNEYRLNGQPSFDIGYSVNYHRMVSWDATKGAYCLLSPGQMATGTTGSTLGIGTPAASTSDPPTSYNFTNMFSMLQPGTLHTAQGKVNVGASGPLDNCTFALNGDGNIDAVRDLVRFGLMTFDNDLDPGVGVNTTGSLQTIAVNAAQGLWSYFPGWNSPGVGWPTVTACNPSDQASSCYGTSPFLSSLGSPSVACGLYSPYEVGARNPAAPPWEGRMVQFPDGRAPLTAQESTNDQVKYVVASVRPYGATPIAGMLTDARNYFRFDPSGPEQSDPFVNSVVGGTHGCRQQYIILLTDGGANLDLQPTCSAVAGNNTCPFEPPQNIAKDLCYGGSSGGSGQCTSSGNFDKVLTFVIGFGFQTLTGPDGTPNQTCSQVVHNAGSGICTANLCPTGGYGSTTGTPEQACCNLINVACNGSGGVFAPFFADNAADLNGTFAQILSAVTRQASSHVVPVFATAYGNSGTTSAQQVYFTASYNTGNFETNTTISAMTRPWSGSLVRNSIGCDVNHTDATTDFGSLISSGGASASRNFLVATTTNSAATATDTTSLRPFVSTVADGLASTSATEVLSSGFSVFTPPNTTQQHRDFQISSGYQCPADPVSGAHLDDQHCALYAADFYAGLSVPTSAQIPGPTGSTAYSYSTSRASVALGPIINSVPAYVSAPSLALSDTSYRSFAQTYAARPNTIYVESTDGALHAFNADYQSSTDTPEFFTFLPPADISLLASNVPGADKTLLDGSPVVADTVWSRTTTISPADWHTTLVSSFGGGGRGYFALDVTNPVPTGWTAATGSTNYPAGSSANGPHFLWQITNVAATSNSVELFGANGVTPAITTLYAQVGTDPLGEVGVAILPGGSDGGSPTGTCVRTVASSDLTTPYATGTASSETRDYTTLPSTTAGTGPRNMVRSWSAQQGGTNSTACSARVGVTGRSVSIVRLSDGLVIATFLNPVDNAALPTTTSTSLTKRLLTTFDSPMVGTPVTYPAGGGRLARSAYVSDADGLIWKLDLHDPSPANWTSSLFFDSMNKMVTQGGTTVLSDANAANVSQALTGPPILSIGPDSSLVLNFATGDQTLFSTAAFVAGSQDTVADEIPIVNFVWSVSDMANVTTSGTLSHWYVPFDQTSQYNSVPNVGGYTYAGTNGTPKNNFGERVTGPMSVFDGVLYFATLKPADGAAACAQGEARLYGMDYFNLDRTSWPASGSACALGVNPSIGCGGERRLLPLGGVVPQFTVPGVSTPSIAGAEIPGVAVTEVQSCSTAISASGANYFGSGTASYQVPSAAQTPTLSFVTTSNTPTTVGGTTVPTQALTVSQPILPQVQTTKVDSWASVIN